MRWRSSSPSYLQVLTAPVLPLSWLRLLPWKVCVCSVGSPVPVHYPSSLHSEPRVLPEPVASLRASHCSPVFYLLDNGKRRDIVDLGLAIIIICFIYSSDWEGGWGHCFDLWPWDRWWLCVASCMPAVLAVLWVPLSAADTFSHPKSIFFCGKWKVFGRNKEKISLRASFFGGGSHPPQSVATDVPINLVACIATMLKPAVQAALAMRSMRVCRWLLLWFVCPRLSAGGVTWLAVCVRFGLQGLGEEGIVFQMGSACP